MSVEVFFLMALAFCIALGIALHRLNGLRVRSFTRIVIRVGIVGMVFYMGAAGFLWLHPMVSEANMAEANIAKNLIYMWGFYGAFPSFMIAAADYLYLHNKQVVVGREPALLALAVFAAQTYFCIYICDIGSIAEFFAVYTLGWPSSGYLYIATLWVIGLLATLQPAPQPVSHRR